MYIYIHISFGLGDTHFVLSISPQHFINRQSIEISSVICLTLHQQIELALSFRWLYCWPPNSFPLPRTSISIQAHPFFPSSAILHPPTVSIRRTPRPPLMPPKGYKSLLHLMKGRICIVLGALESFGRHSGVQR